MTTDTSERGLERLICTALAGHPCEPPVSGTTWPKRRPAMAAWAGAAATRTTTTASIASMSCNSAPS